MRQTQPAKLEKVLERTRLFGRPDVTDMEASIEAFFRRVPGKARYPTGREKDLYAPFAYILLSEPAIIPALLHELGTPAALVLQKRLGDVWRAHRVSTVRRDRGTHWKDPHCLPGGAGKGAIADVVILLNPSFDNGKQVSADALLYFELKSTDRRSHDPTQISAHLAALAANAPTNGFLGAVGGRPVQETHRQWLGHVSLSTFLAISERVASDKILSADIRTLRRKLQNENALA